MRMTEASEGFDSERARDAQKRQKKDAMKAQNFKGQAEITSGFATTFTGPVLLVCVSECASASAEVNHGKPAEGLTPCLDINPQEDLNSLLKVPPVRASIKAMAKQNGEKQDAG